MDAVLQAAACPDFVPPAGVGAEDLQAVAASWQARPGAPGWDPRFDRQPDGVISALDILMVSTLLGETCL
jgi:hypothetical protein